MAAENNTKKKAVDLEALGKAVDKIKEGFATKDEVEQKIEQAAIGGAGITFATEAEVLALFEDAAPES